MNKNTPKFSTDVTLSVVTPKDLDSNTISDIKTAVLIQTQGGKNFAQPS